MDLGTTGTKRWFHAPQYLQSPGQRPCYRMSLDSDFKNNNVRTRIKHAGERADHGRKPAILKQKKERKSIKAIGHSQHNNLECPEKETIGVLSNRYGTCRSRKTTTDNERNIVRAVRKNPKATVSYITNSLQGAGWKFQNSSFEECFESVKYRGHTTKDANHWSAVKMNGICKEVQRWATKVLDESFMAWWNQV